MAKITTDYARQLAKNYRNTKLGQPLLATDTSAVWFDKETILEALGLDPKTVTRFSGLRFYLGAYENKASAPAEYPKNRDWCSKLTLVIVPTVEVSKKHKDDLEEPDAKPAYPKRFTYDDGQLCPPPNCDSEGLLNFS